MCCWRSTGPSLKETHPMNCVETRDLDDGPESNPPSASILATCTHCEKLHHAAPLEFNPVCSACAAERATMRSLEMKGSYPLSDAGIGAELTGNSPGNYALGYLEDDRFVVFYVGRSDTDLRQSLQDWVGAPSRYEQYAPSGRAAWGTRRRGAMPIDTPALGPVGCGAGSSYTRFAYSYASSPEAALEKELRNYDDFGGRGGLDNEQPPARRLDDAGSDPA
jgi:hypothetical protein